MGSELNAFYHVHRSVLLFSKQGRLLFRVSNTSVSNTTTKVQFNAGNSNRPIKVYVSTLNLFQTFQGSELNAFYHVHRFVLLFSKQGRLLFRVSNTSVSNTKNSHLMSSSQNMIFNLSLRLLRSRKNRKRFRWKHHFRFSTEKVLGSHPKRQATLFNSSQKSHRSNSGGNSCEQTEGNSECGHHSKKFGNQGDDR